MTFWSVGILFLIESFIIYLKIQVNYIFPKTSNSSINCAKYLKNAIKMKYFFEMLGKIDTNY